MLLFGNGWGIVGPSAHSVSGFPIESDQSGRHHLRRIRDFMTGPASKTSLDPKGDISGPAPDVTSAQIADKPHFSRRLSRKLGPYVVILAVVSAIFTLLVMSGFTPIEPAASTITILFGANLLMISALLGLLVIEIWTLVAEVRARAAGARLHIRIVTLFSIIAATPAVLIAITGSLTLQRSLNPAIMQDLRGFVLSTADAAKFFRDAQCRSLLQETQLTASDLDRIQPTFITNRALFHDYFESRARILGFTTAALIERSGQVIERIETGPNTQFVTPEMADFDDAKKGEALCLLLDDGLTFVALRPLINFKETFVYAARPLDPFAIEFPKQANNLVELYDAFDAHRLNIIFVFALMFALFALVMLMSASWIGISFANRLVTPIQRLISATDQVAIGNLQVQVPVKRSEGDLAHLGETFNKMTSELRLQQNRLVAASRLNDQRRIFTEAVLSGVPAAVIGITQAGRISVVNASALRLVEGDVEDADKIIGMTIDSLLPELVTIIEDARRDQQRRHQSQITLLRNGRERSFNVRVTSEKSSDPAGSFVITLDDITDLVTAQRTAAWADVARRIAHEIKNPLTPIQLSAERLQRKYGRLITQDREIFDQCTDTIVRQVEDIKRMVDEFSSFARMPKASPVMDDLSSCLRQVMFLMRIGNPKITFTDHLPPQAIRAVFDRRLMSQALTNVLKNATEGILALPDDERPEPKIDVNIHVTQSDLISIDIIDNGKGFPLENRQRLLEPYMTTRDEGTGLGLPIVAKILEDHGGGIELLDAPEGRGARVHLFFPRHVQESKVIAQDHTPARDPLNLIR